MNDQKGMIQADTHKRKVCSAVWLLIVITAFVSGCGKKAPPYLPEQYAIPAVKDLKAELMGNNSVNLTWTVPETTSSHLIKGFTVYRSKKAAFLAECKKCPTTFDPVADTPLKSESVMTYTEKIDVGYRYLYKIRAYTDKASGPDSNVVEFVY